MESTFWRARLICCYPVIHLFLRKWRQKPLMTAAPHEVTKLRFFGGLSIDETAEALKVSPGTVMLDWTFARAWLRQRMTTA